MRQWVASRLQNPVVALLAKAAGWNAVSQLVTKVAMVVFTVVASRVLGVSELGFLFTLQGAMLLVAAAADAGTSTYIQQQLAGRESGSAAVASLVTLRLWLAGVVTVGWVVVAQLLWDLSVAEVVLVALGGLAFSASLFVQAVLGYLHEFRVVSEALFAGRLVLCVAAPLAFVLDGAVLVPFLLGGLAGAEVVTLLYSLWRVRTRLDGVRTAFANRPGDRRARMLLAIRASAPHTLNSLINVVVNRADALLVTVFAGLTVAGLYAPASQLQNALGGVLVLLAAGSSRRPGSVPPARRASTTPAALRCCLPAWAWGCCSPPRWCCRSARGGGPRCSSASGSGRTRSLSRSCCSPCRSRPPGCRCRPSPSRGDRPTG
ncbi:oligosaccharide flippase family protein [Klenkia terrae]|uniref:oligosaccharide flippase family protein n=1 Tax=Klenkia terrae TaxID=1052259 RepID=UPI003615A862